MEEDEDVHYCLCCHATIHGLEDYIKHKKQNCPSRKEKHLLKQPVITSHATIHASSSANITPTATLSTRDKTFIEKHNHFSKSEAKETFPNGNEPSISCQNVLACQTVQVSFSSYETTKPLLSPERYSLDIFHDEKSPKNVPYSYSSQSNALLSPGLVVSTHTSVDPNLIIGNNATNGTPTTSTSVMSIEAKDKSLTDKEGTHHDIPDAASVAEFFASLELKIRQPGDKRQNIDISEIQDQGTSEQANVVNVEIASEQKDDAFEERLKNIKIANILTDLDFSSDSEGLPSDVDELLNFSDEEDEYRSGGKWKPGGSHPPAGHTKGKWRPGGKLASYGKHGKGAVGKHGGKWKPGMLSPPQTGSKWKSGQRVLHGQGKHGKLKAYKVHRGLTDSEDEEKDEKSEKKKRLSKGNKSEAGTYCEVCKKHFKSHYYLSMHKNTSYHKKRASNDKLNTSRIKCAFCDKTISSKSNYARHLVKEHNSGNENKEKLDVSSLEESIQQMLLLQKPYQCKVCMFYCEIESELDSHMVSEDHVNKCKMILGPLYCKRCQEYANSNDEMIQHMKGSTHYLIVENSNRPCIIKESRTNVQCKICDQVLTSYTKLCEHMKAAHGSNRGTLKRRGIVNRPRCQYCEQQCRSEAILDIHVRRKHTGEKPFCCETCMVGFVRNTDLQRHFESAKHIETAVQLGTKRSYSELERNETDENSIDKNGTNKKLKVTIKCKFNGCLYKALTRTSLAEHYKEVHSSDKRFVCDLCGYAVNHKSHYDKHCLTKRHLDLVEASESANSLTVKSELQEESSLNCSSCNLVFKNEAAFHKHKISHMVTTEEGLYKKSNGDELKHIDKKYHEFIKGLTVDVDDDVTCPETNCGKTLKRKFIVSHIRSHTDYKPFNCVYCDKSFHRGERLRAHLLVHFPRKWHNCDNCASKFRDIRSLKQHILSNHPDNVSFEAAFICSTCGYKCMTSTLLRVHMFSHMEEEEKKFRCPWPGCSKCFQFKSAMSYHVRRHTQEKPYLCDQCGFAAIDKQHLNRHKRKHTGIRTYKCEYCTYSYYNASGLRRHMRVHINARPFKCPYCSFTANSIEHIRKHVNCNSKHVSKGEFLYPCLHCKAGFKFQAELKQHLHKDHHLEVTNKDTHISTLHPNLVSETAKLKYVPAGQKINPVEEKYVAKKWQREQQLNIETVDVREESVKNQILSCDDSLRLVITT